MTGAEAEPRVPTEAPAEGDSGEPGGPQGTLLRIGSRSCFVAGVLFVVAVGRIDDAVRTAYATGWVALGEAGNLAVDGSCDRCSRLPSSLWIVVYSLFSAAITAALLGAIWFTFVQVKGTRPLGRFLLWGSGVAAALALGAAVLRACAAAGVSSKLLTFAFVLTALGLVTFAAMAFAIANATGPPDPSRARRARLFLQRQGVNLVVVAVLAVTVTVVPQTSGQAIDSIRTWGFGTGDEVERLALGLAAILLLSLVLYESASRLEQAPMPRIPDKRPPVRARWSLVAGLMLIGGGALLAWLGPFGLDLAGVGFVLLVIAALEWIEPPPARPDSTSGSARVGMDRPLKSHAPEYFAIVPLLAVASVAVAAAVESALTEGWAGDTRDALVAALILAAIAAAMVGPSPARLDPPRLLGWLVAGFVTALTIGVALLADGGAAAVVLSFLPAAVLLVYVAWVFPCPYSSTRPRRMYAPPVALGVGVVVFIATHRDVHALAPSIGVFTVVFIGIASALAAVHFLVRAGLGRRPPKALRALGVQNFPVLTALAAAWFVAGALPWTPPRHAARLVDRPPVATTSGLKRPVRQTLDEAFVTWRNAQPELRSTAQASSVPLPLVLVASHGGGVRAAYWTALALDCIVGGTALGVRPLSVADEDVRRQTCETRRSPEDQQRAARRIFIASGVSGGAMGLYGYARELLSRGQLDDGWVEKRMGRDFASSTIAWSLFHDLPNHFFGLHSDAGGCELRVIVVGWCLSSDRAAVLEDAFDRSWPRTKPPRLRHTWDLRSSNSPAKRDVAELVPMLVTNATVSGGRARAFVSAANLGTWPLLETHDFRPQSRRVLPLAGVVDAVDALCNSKDLRLSTAAYLGARFPFVGPSGHLEGNCLRNKRKLEAPERVSPRDEGALCLKNDCQTSLVDGGYADNSGLLTIDLLWPALHEMVVAYNRSENAKRQIAPIIIELDNHYQARLESPLPAGGIGKESLVPISTAFGARNSIETMARSLAYRYLPPLCTVTIAPSLHPGLVAPLGWELSETARVDLESGLYSPHPLAKGKPPRFDPAYKLRRLQQWLSVGSQPAPDPSQRFNPGLGRCVAGGAGTNAALRARNARQ